MATDQAILHFTANGSSVVTGGAVEVLSANLAGTVSANDSVTQIDGAGGTSFDTDFAVGDYIAVWANSSYYEYRSVASVTDSDTMDIAASPLFTSAIDGSGFNYAFVTPPSGLTSNTSENVMTASIAQVWHSSDAGGAWIVGRGNSSANQVVGVYGDTGHVGYQQYGEMLDLAKDGQTLWVTRVNSSNGYLMIDLRKESSF